MNRPTRKPQDRLTRIADEMTHRFDMHREHLEGDKCIVFLSDPDRAGICIHGYEGTPDEGMQEAIVDLFLHLKKMMNSIGKDIDFVAIPDSLESL